MKFLQTKDIATITTSGESKSCRIDKPARSTWFISLYALDYINIINTGTIIIDAVGVFIRSNIPSLFVIGPEEKKLL